jgi:YbbR domain-containing protein
VNLLKGSFFLKLLALAAAVFTYLYAHNEMDTIKQQFSDPSYKLLRLTAKKLPLKVRLATEPPDGYRLVEGGVVSEPSQILVIGPQALLEDASSVETALIDVGETTKTVTKKIPVESVSGIHLAGDPYFVDVTIPIQPIEKPDEPAKPEKAS